MKHILLIALVILASCSAHRVSLKPIDIYGSNEQRIPEPELQ